MTRKASFSAHPDIGSGRVGLAVAEMQTFQCGYSRLLAEMLGGCDVAIVALGSTQRHGVVGHPFSFEQRKDMIEGVFGPAFRFIALQDIDASLDTDDWMAYVLGRIRGHNLPAPTDYYTGSEIDARFYTGYFASLQDPKTTNGLIATHDSAKTGRRLHIVDRSATPALRGRDVRLLIENRDDEWKRYVPAKLWAYIERNYPPQLRTALRGADFPKDVPVGTRCILDGETTVHVLRDDGKWRPLDIRRDEKADWAANRKAGA